jgi:hypothetical protein
MRQRLPPRRVGLGAGSVASFAASTLSANSGTILQALPTNIQSAIATGQTYIQNGIPAFDLASTIGSGGVPSSQQVVLGLAAVAGAINPIAGGIMLAAGEAIEGVGQAFQSVFTALGLYSPPTPAWAYVGLIRYGIDPIPYPPQAGGAVDPAWMTFPSFFNIPNLALNTPPNMPAPYQPDAASSVRNGPFIGILSAGYMRQTPPDSTTLGEVNAHVDSSGDKLIPGKPGDGYPYLALATLQPYAPTHFEQYFNTLLIQNLTYWANGNPFLPVRTLLGAAQGVWNAANTGAQVCFQPGTVDWPFGVNGSIPPYQQYGSTIPWLLGPSGGLTDNLTPTLSDNPQLCVTAPNGPGVTSATVAPGAPPANVAASVAAVPIGVGLGVVAYSLALGQARDTALKGLWGWVRARL